MRSKLLEEQREQTFVLVFEPGDEVTEGLLAFARKNDLTAAHFTGIGAFQDVVLGYFQIDRKEYKRIELREQVEVLSLVGNVAVFENHPQVHAHVVVGRSDGTTMGGHLLEAHVRPTLELVVHQGPSTLRRQFDPETRLPLIGIR